MSDLNNIPSYSENLEELVGQLKGMFPEDKFKVFNDDANRLARNYQSPLVLKKGDKAPLFELPNAQGKPVSMADLLAKGPVVLTFYRGAWCPYCNLHLKLLQQVIPEMAKVNASMVAISPMNPDSSQAIIEANELQFEVLSDAGNKIARQYTQVFRNADESINAMSDLGYDFYSFYDDRTAELPVSATFIISSDGIVSFAESEGGDYRLRTEPAKILQALKSIQ